MAKANICGKTKQERGPVCLQEEQALQVAWGAVSAYAGTAKPRRRRCVARKKTELFV